MRLRVTERGEARRVELARALAPEPDVLLLDEPLSALDKGLRARLREEIVRIQRQTGVTTLFVTHDQEDAMSVADRLVVLRDGAIVAAGAPRQLYESPPARFVASFLGRSNELSATVDGDGSTAMRIGGTEVDLDAVPGEVADAPRAIVHIRPGDLTVNPRRCPIGGRTTPVPRQIDRTRRLMGSGPTTERKRSRCEGR